MKQHVNYIINASTYDFGCATDTIEVQFEKDITQLSFDDICVKETSQTTDFSKKELPVIEDTKERIVEDVAYFDNVIQIYLKVDPTGMSPIHFSFETQYNTYSHPYSLDIQFTNLKINNEPVDLLFNNAPDCIEHEGMLFEHDTKEIDHITYNYAFYKSESKSKKLVVWLHGLGEGGSTNHDTNSNMMMLASKVGNLFGLEEDVNILVPQCPTYWMDEDGTGTSLHDGRITCTNKSYYLASLTKLIDEYKKETGSQKVIITGCSNGGYMTMLLAINHGDKYQGYVPICEALANEYISDTDIEVLKKLPMYFIYAKNDPIVDPTIHEIPLLERLKDSTTIQYAISENVVSKEEGFTDAKGNPFEYNGHWSWIYFFNDSITSNTNQTPFKFIESI